MVKLSKKRRFSRARRYYARARSRVKKTTIPIAPIAGIIATPAIQEAVPLFIAGRWQEGLKVMTYITGLDASGNWHIESLVKNLSPMVAGVATHKIANKLGINRALASAGVPYLRV